MTEPTTIRESLEAAIEAAPVVEQAPAPEPEYSSEPAAQVATSSEPVASTGTDLNALAEQENQPRDDQGKFKKPESPEITPGPKAGPKVDKAPASWRPEVREHWNQLPDSVRSEVARRETEVQRTLQETAQARQYAESISRAFQPYEAYIKAEGANPLQVIDNLMGTAVRLRTSTGPELAGLMAGMVQQFGTGRFGQQFIEMLDSALAGNAPRQDPAQMQIQQTIQQQLAPVQQFMSQFQQAQAAQQAQVAQQAVTEVEQFISRAEFGNDVRNEMADLMEVASRRGQQLSMQDAYRQACLMNPQVRAALQARQKTRQAQNQTGVAQRARAAAVSVPSSGPGMAPKQAPTDIRSAIEAAIAMTSR
jgi:hypothetical protein